MYDNQLSCTGTSRRLIRGSLKLQLQVISTLYFALNIHTKFTFKLRELLYAQNIS